MKRVVKQLNVLDLFCGCGGLSKGFEMAGFNVVGGIDFNKQAIDTFSYNFKNAISMCADLLEMDNDIILESFNNINSIDVIIGGPPCQGFSNANRYGNEKDDPRNKLFFEFVKFVDLAHPKIVLIENVRGIITNNNGYAKKRITEIFEERGYCVSQRILNAADFGVPQNRFRNFFVMSNTKLPFNFDDIKINKNKVDVVDAIGELYRFENDIKDVYKIETKADSKYRKYLRSKDNLIYNHDIRYPALIVQERISFVPQGGNWMDVPENLWSNNRKNRHSSAYKRLKEDDQSCTIDTGNNHSNYFHPLFNRIPTVREAARLQSFPDDFIIKGNRSEQYRQIGNAVPPLLSKSIAIEIRKILENS